MGGERAPDFRFSVKLPRTITHERRLVDCAEPLERFLGEAGGLGEKLAVLLLQLPPKLAYDESLARNFLERLAELTPARIVCEPRHPSWFEDAPDALLDRLRVARVAADPAVVPQAALPGGWRGLTYRRLHGSPVIYRSAYEGPRLDDYARQIETELDEGRPSWCIFDNTASSAATGDALALAARLEALSHFRGRWSLTMPRPAPISRPSPQRIGTGRAVAQRVQRIDRLRFHGRAKLQFSRRETCGFLRLSAARH